MEILKQAPWAIPQEGKINAHDMNVTVEKIHTEEKGTLLVLKQPHTNEVFIEEKYVRVFAHLLFKEIKK